MSSKRTTRFGSSSTKTPLLPPQEPIPTPSSSSINTNPFTSDSAPSNRSPTSTPEPSQKFSRTSKTVTALFAQVHSVRDIALKNVELLNKRQGDLQELEEISRNLESGSRNFDQTTNQIKEKYQKENSKLQIILIGIICAALFAVIIWAIVTYA